MNARNLRIGAIACGVLCAILLFVACERYATNADNVAAMNAFRTNSPFGRLGDTFGEGELTPATPTASKYAMFFAFLSAIGGVTCLVLAKRGSGHARERADHAG